MTGVEPATCSSPPAAAAAAAADGGLPFGPDVHVALDLQKTEAGGGVAETVEDAAHATASSPAESWRANSGRDCSNSQSLT